MHRTRRILMVVANPAVATTTGWPVGFWAAELVHPYDAFVRDGYDVEIASPNGGRVEVDALSDPRDPGGYSESDALSREYLERPEFAALLASTPRVADRSADDFDALVVAGGQSPMFTFEGATALHERFLDFVRADKVVAALCHGTCVLLYLTRADGRPFVEGRTMTGFSNAEEDYVDRTVGRKVMPFRIEDEARRLGANFVAGAAFAPHAVRDGRLITGQQQNSGAETARRVLRALAEG